MISLNGQLAKLINEPLLSRLSELLDNRAGGVFSEICQEIARYTGEFLSQKDDTSSILKAISEVPAFKLDTLTYRTEHQAPALLSHIMGDKLEERKTALSARSGIRKQNVDVLYSIASSVVFGAMGEYLRNRTENMPSLKSWILDSTREADQAVPAAGAVNTQKMNTAKASTPEVPAKTMAKTQPKVNTAKTPKDPHRNTPPEPRRRSGLGWLLLLLLLLLAWWLWHMFHNNMNRNVDRLDEPRTETTAPATGTTTPTTNDARDHRNDQTSKPTAAAEGQDANATTGDDSANPTGTTNGLNSTGSADTMNSTGAANGVNSTGSVDGNENASDTAIGTMHSKTDENTATSRNVTGAATEDARTATSGVANSNGDRDPSIAERAAAKFKDIKDFFSQSLPDGKNLRIPRNGMEAKLLDVLKSDKPANPDQWITMDRILFDTNSARLDAASEEQLENLADILKAYPNAVIRIGGYTDNTGTVEINQRLSQQRADVVMQALKDLGIDGNRMTAKGYGRQHPVASNDTEEGRAKNRRIDIRIDKK